MDTTVVVALVAFAGGAVFGLVVALALRLTQAKSAERLAEDILRASEAQRKSEEQALLATMENDFGRLSNAIFRKSNESFLQLAEQTLKAQTVQNAAELDGKKQLIDQQLGSMNEQLGRVSDLMAAFENERSKQYGALGEQLSALNETSARLQRALGDSRTRGQWGERIAEDILRLAGFVENINYRKQLSVEGSRPDFTFFLPKNLVLNMDVKFPLDNYLKCLDAQTDAERRKYGGDFVRDVRGHMSGLTRREYVNPEQSTVDFVLMFIPNEQIYRFIHEEDRTIIDDSLRKKVILCSPLTLFVVLAIIRQASDNFALETSSREILVLLNRFKKQWGMFTEKMEEVDRHMKRANESYAELMTRRWNALEKPLKSIDGLMTKYSVDTEIVDLTGVEADFFESNGDGE